MHPIERLIHEGEHQQLDFKFRVDDARKIAITLVAFANTDGGRLLIGVKDNGKIAGVRSDEEFHVIQAAAQLYSKPEIAFQAVSHQVENKEVLEVIVEPSSVKPHFALAKDQTETAYFRKDDQNHPANGVLLEYWRMSTDGSRSAVLEQYGDVHRKLYELLESGERVNISRLCKSAGIDAREARHILATFLRWELIKYDFDQKGIHFVSAEN